MNNIIKYREKIYELQNKRRVEKTKHSEYQNEKSFVLFKRIHGGDFYINNIYSSFN